MAGPMAERILINEACRNVGTKNRMCHFKLGGI